jgi:ABC-type transporter Mla subunit MlaD
VLRADERKPVVQGRSAFLCAAIDGKGRGLAELIKITDEGMRSVHSALATATAHLEQVLRNMKNQDSAALGAPVMSEKASAFSDSWAYAVEQIGSHAADLDKFIQAVSDTFSRLDQQLETDLGKGA